ncbi:hypothetical protein C2845_PM01G19030 [Panicum miliaceum]|uniref:Uncharacterized protein n=1 Tax=Panicum miliaceum TaxID=4540 RepID=A0A3L6TNF1_PANMI|nr:hypothetical protein C2845_PM01G19030 [Panicum miliaceum]
MKTTTATSATVLFLSIALLCGVLVSAVDAARQLPAEGRAVVETHEAAAAAAYTTLRERAWSKTTAMAWTQQLPSGPSPRGPGH